MIDTFFNLYSTYHSGALLWIEEITTYLPSIADFPFLAAYFPSYRLTMHIELTIGNLTLHLTIHLTIHVTIHITIQITIPVSR